MPEQSLADVGEGDRPQSLQAAAGRVDRHVTYKLGETPDWSSRSGDEDS